jgi:hypothetical protein
MDQWWFANKGPFQRDEIHPGGVTCVTASRGKGEIMGIRLIENTQSRGTRSTN